MSTRPRKSGSVIAACALALGAATFVLVPTTAGATDVNDDDTFRAAFTNAAETLITLTTNIALDCADGPVVRNSATPITINGGGTFQVSQCTTEVMLVQQGTGDITLQGVTLVGGTIAVVSETTGNVILDNSVVTGATSAASTAIGISTDDGDVTLNESVVNGTSGGGTAIGIASETGDVVLQGSGSTVSNTVGGSAIGISSTDGDVTLIDSHVVGTEASAANTALGITTTNGDVSLSLSTVGNTSSVSGTAIGIGVSGTSNVTLDGSVVVNTTTVGTALGIAGSGGDVMLTASSVQNTAASGATGIGISTSGEVALTNSQVFQTSSGTGVAIGVSGLDGVIMTDAVVNNTASSNSVALGVTADDADATLVRSTVSQVMSPVSVALGVASTFDVSMTDSTVTTITGDIAIGVSAEVDATLVRSTVDGVNATNFGSAVSSGNDVRLVNSTIASNMAIAIAAGGNATLVYSDVVANGAAIVEVLAGSIPDSIVLPEGTGTVRLPSGVRAQQAEFFQLEIEGSLTLFGTVIVLPLSGFENCDVLGTITTNGYNFSDDTTCELTGTGDRQGAGLNPLLGSLAQNGGPTRTLLPADNSPLVNAIPGAACQADGAAGVVTDQRGIVRPQSSLCDIGSVELLAPIVLVPAFTG